MVEGTVAAWVDAVTMNRQWDECQDAPRFRKAFATLGQTRSSWPAPRDFLEALPPRAELKALPAKPSDPARAQACIDEIARLLRMPK